MANRCVVNGCTSGSVSDRNKHRKLGTKNPSLFTVPQHLDLLELWESELSQKLVPKKNYVCELHFNEEDIIKSDKIKTANGIIEELVRKRYALKQGAIPTLNPKKLSESRNIKDVNSPNSPSTEAVASEPNNIVYINENYSHQDSELQIDEDCNSNYDRLENFNSRISSEEINHENEEKLETIVVKDEDSDCEIVAATQGQVDVPEYIDPKSLRSLLDEPPESLPPVIEKIVSTLSNDEAFDRECDKYYKANLEMDVEYVQVDVVKVLFSSPRSPEAKTISLSSEIDIRTTTDLPGICSLCGDSDDHVQLLLVHLRERHQLKQDLFVCPFCDYTSIKYEVVMKHTTKVHKLVSEQHKCDQCDYKTFRGDLYNRHLNQHLKEKIYSCDHCNYKTINVINFKRHLSSKHTKETEYKCQSCDFASNNIGVVKRHEAAKHTSQKVFPCNKCPYITTLAHTLKRHQERYCKNRSENSKVLTYTCVHCNFKTESLSSLEDHTLLTHPKKEILFCNLCEYSTTESADLTKHAQEHLKNEPINSEN